MPANATAQKDTTAALRHAVYADLLSMLPIASFRQVERFVANLALAREAYQQPTVRSREAEIWRVMQRFILLRVTPDLAEAKRPTPDCRVIELAIEKKYGDRLEHIAGFYRNEAADGGVRVPRWRVNLPEGCALYGYRSREGFYTGILCQPLDRDDLFFLLSSSKFDGPKAMRLTDADRAFFESFKQPTGTRGLVGISADMAGYRWTGRRFVEVKNA